MKNKRNDTVGTVTISKRKNQIDTLTHIYMTPHFSS